MRCEDARPFVSALYDHELVPADAAEHINACAECRARLRDYAEMGAELRLLASRTLSEAVAPIPGPLPELRRSRWVRRWSAPVLVPRYVAAPVLASILVLLAGLGVVQAQRSTEAASQEFHLAVSHGDVAKVAAMLQKNRALANTPGEWGMMPLHDVATPWIPDDNTCVRIAQILIASGADVNARTPNRETPLHVALLTHTKRALVALLLAHGADLNARDWMGMTPLDRALQDRDPTLAQMLREHGAKPDIFNAAQSGDSIAVSEWLTRDPSLINARDGLGRTPLEIAAADRHPQLVQLLLTYEPHMDIYLAAVSGQTALVQKFLDGNPPLVNTENERGMTPLYFAALGGHTDVAELLLRRGADVHHGKRRVLVGPLDKDVPRVWWIEPLAEAAYNGDRDMALFLLKHGANPLAHSGPGGAAPYHLAVMNGHKDLAEEMLRSRHDSAQ